MCCLHDLETLRVGEVVRERKLERHVANTGAAAEATATKWPRQLTLQDKLASWENAETAMQKYKNTSHAAVRIQLFASRPRWVGHVCGV